jgi:hypothetical protein
MVTDDPRSNLEQRERVGVIQSLAAGTVPLTGLRRLQVGREKELDAILADLKVAEAGVSTVRFVAGRPESGKTFFLNLVRSVAAEQGFLVIRTDFTMGRRLHSTSGEARAFYRALMTNIYTKDHLEGTSLGRVLCQWVEQLEEHVRSEGGGPDQVREHMMAAVRPLHEYVGGFDTATVLCRYYEGHLTGNDELCENALRWLRAEYEDKAEAHADLGVRTIMDDAAIKDALNLFAAFVRIAGYSGLLIIADDLTALSRRLRDGTERGGNFEAIVQLHNDCLQGRSKWMVVLFGIEDSCVEDRQRGLYSNAVLATWLAPNRFASNGQRDLSSPIIRLEALAGEDYVQLLRKVRDVFTEPGGTEPLIPEEGIQEYIRTCTDRMGQAYFDTPREVVKDFIDLLHLLAQDPSADWRDLLASAEPADDARSMDYPLTGAGVRGGSVDWYIPPLEEERPTSSPLRVISAVVVPFVIIALALIGWGLMTASTPTMAARLEVKYSDFRGGLRRPLDQASIPLRVGNFFSVAVTDSSEPLYMYVLTVDGDGRVAWLYGHDGSHAPAVDLQIPGAEKMWPLGEPAGTRTVLLFATKSPIEDPALFKASIEALKPLPVTRPTSMFVLDGDQPQELRNPLHPQSYQEEVESDSGFLRGLTEKFKDRFEVIRAVSFPLLPPAELPRSRTVFEFGEED